MATVEIRNLQKIYPGASEATIKNADIHIRDREFVVLVGPSGCGKSTLLRMVAGLEEITAGDLVIDGRRVNELSPKDRDIAMVFQNYALYPHMTVYDNMAFGLKLRKVPKAEIRQRVEEAAAILGITPLLKRRPKEMSGGQRQRVAIGRSIVRDPKVFLFDEPLSNLDAKLRVQMRAEIKRLHRQLKATMLYVTHDQIEAMTMGDRIVLLKDGSVQQFDTPMNLFHEPVNKFVAGFIGSPAMNFLEGTIERTDGLQFRSGHLDFRLPGSLSDQLHNYTGKKVTLGFRPEYLYDAGRSANTSGIHLEAIIDLVEPIGSETYNYFHFKGQQAPQSFCYKSDATVRYEPGQSVKIGIEAGKMFFFDADNGTRLA